MNVPSDYVCTEAFGRVNSKGACSPPLRDSSFTFCVYSVEKRSLASPRGHEQQQHLRWIPGLHLIDTACDLWCIFASIYHYSSLSTCHFTLEVTSLPSHSSRLFVSFSLHWILIHVEMNMSEFVLPKQIDQCLKVSIFIFRVNRLVIPAAKKRCGSFVKCRLVDK